MVNRLERQQAQAEARAASMKAKPHIVYGAKVFLTMGETTPETKWTCGLVSEGVTTQILGGGQFAPGWYYSFPCAHGSTPAAACEAFDRLWETGDAEPKKPAVQEKEQVIVEIDGGCEGAWCDTCEEYHYPPGFTFHGQE